MVKVFVTVCMACFVGLFAMSGQPLQWTRMDDSKLLIGAYCLQPNARTDEHVKAVRDCGVDFIVGIPVGDRDTLDLFARHGVGAVVNNVVSKRTREIKFEGHPAIWAVDIGDEPPATEFARYRDLVAALSSTLPGVPLYLNLNPNYGRVVENTEEQIREQLGTETYRQYLDSYCEIVPLNYISYDFYPYIEGATQASLLSKMYDNFIVVSDACRKTGRAFWYIPQLNSRPGQAPLSANKLRFQANAALSFGATRITWGCWSRGWWDNNVLDEDGRQTGQYAKLKEVNSGLKRIEQEYMRFRNVGTHFVGFVAEAHHAPNMPMDQINALSVGSFSDVRASNGASILVGEMIARDGSRANALYITAADDPLDEHNAIFNILFKARNIQAFGSKGKIEMRNLQDGSCAVPISSCEGVLLVANK